MLTKTRFIPVNLNKKFKGGTREAGTPAPPKHAAACLG